MSAMQMTLAFVFLVCSVMIRQGVWNLSMIVEMVSMIYNYTFALISYQYIEHRIQCWLYSMPTKVHPAIVCVWLKDIHRPRYFS